MRNNVSVAPPIRRFACQITWGKHNFSCMFPLVQGKNKQLSIRKYTPQFLLNLSKMYLLEMGYSLCNSDVVLVSFRLQKDRYTLYLLDQVGAYNGTQLIIKIMEKRR